MAETKTTFVTLTLIATYVVNWYNELQMVVLFLICYNIGYRLSNLLTSLALLVPYIGLVA